MLIRIITLQVATIFFLCIESVICQNILVMQPKNVFEYYSVPYDNIIIKQKGTSQVKILAKLNDYQYQVYTGYEGIEGAKLKDTLTYMYDSCGNLEKIKKNGRMKSLYENSYDESSPCLLRSQSIFYYKAQSDGHVDNTIYKYSYDGNGKVIEMERKKSDINSDVIIESYRYKDSLLNCIVQHTVISSDARHDTLTLFKKYFYNRKGWTILRECSPKSIFNKRTKILKQNEKERVVEMNISNTDSYYPMKILYSKFDKILLPSELIKGKGKNKMRYTIKYTNKE